MHLCEGRAKSVGRFHFQCHSPLIYTSLEKCLSASSIAGIFLNRSSSLQHFTLYEYITIKNPLRSSTDIHKFSCSFKGVWNCSQWLHFLGFWNEITIWICGAKYHLRNQGYRERFYLWRDFFEHLKCLLYSSCAFSKISTDRISEYACLKKY